MSLWLWTPALLGGVWAAHWGADQLAEPFKKLRQYWGLSEAGEAAFAGIAAASPEVAMATVSAFRGVASIGLGATLGTNIMAILIFVAVMPWLYAQFILQRKDAPGFKLWHVLLLDVVLLGWILILIFGNKWLLS